VVYIGSRIQFESKLIKADHRKAERMIEGYNRRASVNNAQFATHLNVEFPWFSGPEAIIEQPHTSTATIAQPTLGVSGSVEEEKQSEFGNYNEAVRRYAEARKTYLEPKVGDNEAWNNWLATNEEVQRAIESAVATWKSLCDEDNEDESCRSFDDDGNLVYLITDEKFNEYNKLGEWRACELQQAQSHLEVAVRKCKEATPDDAR
jgi:NAD(P)H-dependent flavin oxidoreductase YrpB (nitropropane dioxygenase family)